MLRFGNTCAFEAWLARLVRHILKHLILDLRDTLEGSDISCKWSSGDRQLYRALASWGSIDARRKTGLLWRLQGSNFHWFHG